MPALTLVAALAAGLMVADRHTFALDQPVHDVSVTPRDVLLASRRAVSPGGAPVRRDTAIVVAASGGGTQAAAWTARVLSGLDNECGHSCAFSESIALISGTSGGAVGGMFVAQGYDGGSLRASYEQLRDRADRSTEDALWRTLIYRDMFGWLRRIVTTRDDDRGLALERVWEDAMGARPWLSTFQEDARRGLRPGLVFTTARRDTGAPLLTSTAGRAADREDFLASLRATEHSSGEGGEALGGISGRDATAERRSRYRSGAPGRRRCRGPVRRRRRGSVAWHCPEGSERRASSAAVADRGAAGDRLLADLLEQGLRTASAQ